MVLPSTGPISFSDIQTEFGGTNPISLSEYYAGGVFVSASVSGIPTAGTIELSHFRGKSKPITFGEPTIVENGGGQCEIIGVIRIADGARLSARRMYGRNGFLLGSKFGHNSLFSGWTVVGKIRRGNTS